MSDDKIAKKPDWIEEAWEKARQDAMRAWDIPRILYDEISAKMGIEDELKFYELSIRRLDPDHRFTGFSGAIGLQEYVNAYGSAKKFLLWTRVPKLDGSVFEPCPIIEIEGYPCSSGTWAYSRGYMVNERIVLDVPIGGIQITDPGIRLAAAILFRAHELTLDPLFRSDRYWQADKFPGDYTHGDDKD